MQVKSSCRDKFHGINDLLPTMAQSPTTSSKKPKPTCGPWHRMWYSKSRPAAALVARLTSCKERPWSQTLANHP